jgi:predicted metal-dependent hydrolase
MTPERSEVQWGSKRIPYTIQRSARRETVSVAVEPSGSVVLTAPKGTPIPRLDRVVRGKAQWIVERVRLRSDLLPTIEREFISGEVVLYLGRSYRLRVREHGKATQARLEAGHLALTLKRGLGPSERLLEARRAVVGWLRQHAEERLPERVSLWASKLRVDAPEIRLHEQRQRWGSCTSSGTLRLNWRIIQAPMTLVDYVVVHELVHLLHRNHGPAFWAKLGSVIPDYEERKERLRRLGPTFVW